MSLLTRIDQKFLSRRKYLDEQPRQRIEQSNENERQRNIKGDVEFGDHSRHVRLKAAKCVGSGLQQRQDKNRAD
jgi:hypothetical protein